MTSHARNYYLTISPKPRIVVIDERIFYTSELNYGKKKPQINVRGSFL